jgi:hypothetical protein
MQLVHGNGLTNIFFFSPLFSSRKERQREMAGDFLLVCFIYGVSMRLLQDQKFNMKKLYTTKAKTLSLNLEMQRLPMPIPCQKPKTQPRSLQQS